MLLSMTGFGKVNGVFEGKKRSVEIRSLNGKGLDLTLKLPPSYRELEPEFRKIIANQLDRGKIEVGVFTEENGASFPSVINTELAQSYYKSIANLAKDWGADGNSVLETIFRLPNVITTESFEVSQEEFRFVTALLLDCVEKAKEFRATEGLALTEDICNSVDNISQLLLDIEPFESERIPQIRERLAKALTEANLPIVDEGRLEQELLFYMDKLDVAEEKTRLSAHIQYFKTTLKEPNSGKKIGFIIQEMGREINTLGSKSNHSEMQRIVVEMKNYLEKIKEQALNVL